ncbi:MAG: UvrD-helicase domain-containing protein [Chitinophagales bacterium]|nr:UvrD-helicase domain-containing protein [Chitinophagales bacterium]
MDNNLQYKNFEVMTVPLEQSNLIEASAGTGKTYSIAILALRLLLEKQIPIQEILMVTFTKAAVAELEARIREFVRTAWRYTQGENIGDDTIKTVVDKIDRNKATELLRAAFINLDETKVMTIHGFSQQTLNEFAFETGQLFNTELIQDTTSLIDREIQEFWRKHVTTINKDLLAALFSKNKLNQDSIRGIINGHLSGKKYLFYEEEGQERYIFDEAKQETFHSKISDSKEALEAFENAFETFLLSKRDYLTSFLNKNKYAKKTFEKYLSDPSAFLKALKDKASTNYVKDNLHEFLPYLEKYESLVQTSNKNIEDAQNYLYAAAIDFIIPQLQSHKDTFSLMSFDDMIYYLHQALDQESKASKNSNLAQKLAAKYQAVFIDEFQDTDRTQYEIFQMAFHQQSILFYIGDPKQSIYAFRRADIATYLEARDLVPNLYGMNINYRSTRRYVEALNYFFMPKEDFDTFYFNEATDKIIYHQVSVPKQDNKGAFLYKDQPCAPISIQSKEFKANINTSIKSIILDLLTNPDYTIYDNKTQGQRTIRPSDIGILVRTNFRGTELKSELSKVGIPAVTVSDEKILKSEEAKAMIYILEAVMLPTQSNIRRALLTDFIRFSPEQILNLNDEQAIQKFREYYETWKRNGIYVMLTTIIADFDIQNRLLSFHSDNGERILTNLIHLTELLFKVENNRRFEPIETIDWLKVNIHKEQSSDDEWEQRIENDEESVKIVTIHKSKGLQYPIIFTPELDFSLDTKEDRIVSFRNKNGAYVTAKLGQLSEEEKALLQIQSEQENRRLLYVALTRAVYACYIFKNKADSTLSTFLKEIKFNDLIVAIPKAEDLAINTTYKADTTERQNVLTAENFILSETNWERISYSRIAGDHSPILTDNVLPEMTTYDQFIFNLLPKGSKTGNFLHAIFERLDFTKSEMWPTIIQRIINQYYPKSEDSFKDSLMEMLDHVMDTDIPVKGDTINLNQVPLSQCLHELEFDYPFTDLNVTGLHELRDEGINIKPNYSDLSGIMNGKVDLFFKFNDKYYVLDWKSNHLGYHTTDYSSDKIAAAMSANNYHLQYLIYTYAVQKHLAFSLRNFDYERDFGGVIYLFIRGVRKGTTHGIYYQNPSKQQIDKMKLLFEHHKS